MNPPGRYTFIAYYEKVGTLAGQGGWQAMKFSINTRKDWSDAELRAKMLGEANAKRGQLAGSDQKWSGILGDVKRIRVTSHD